MTETTTRFHTTVTERQGFRSCRRRWYYDTVRRLARKNQVPWNLIYGEAVHTGLEHYYLDWNKPRLRKKFLLEAFVAAWEKERDEVLMVDYGSFYDMGIGDEWIRYRDLGLVMLEYYDLFESKQRFFEDIIAVNVEDRAFVDILTPDGTKMLDRPLLSGRIDLVGERKDGKIWIMDHKTAAQTPSYAALDVDDQITGYAYIWWRITGELPRGVFYNCLVKDPPKAPRVNQDGNLSKDKSQRTTFDLYRAEIKAQGLKVADYTEILAALQKSGWSRYFVRDGSERNMEEIESFQERLYYEVDDMLAALEDENYRYPNPSQWNCQGCSMLAICRTHEEQGDVDWVIDDLYEELPSRHEIPQEILSPEWKGV